MADDKIQDLRLNKAIACTAVDQCIRLYGLGQNGVQLHS